MAQIEKKRAENVDGAFYVDTSCIDCDTCRWLAPDSFGRAGDQSYVHQQPDNELQQIKALQAMMACPTASIGNLAKTPLIASVRDMFPLKIDDSVYYCGYHSEKSFGAASYLIIHPEGNILVDSPRFNGPLMKGIEKLGGARYMYFTHRDDVADHRQFTEFLNCQRIMHEDDISRATRNFEIQLQGSDAFSLYDNVQIIPTPGHSQGHTVLHAFDRYLFTGDHLAWSIRLQHLYAFARHCWYDWGEQIASMKRLHSLRFEWVLPGHGRRYHCAAEDMQNALQVCIDWMQKQ